MSKILIVEDDCIICGGVKLFLEKKGLDIETAFTYEEGKEKILQGFDLVILDQNLPDGSGLELCKLLRQSNNVPIIFLTANDTEADMVKGFEAGCDDYVAKPFALEVLYQRVMAILRRSVMNHADKDIFRYKDLEVDFKKIQVSLRGVPIKFSAMEFRILELLIRNRGQVLTRETILSKIWDCDENYIDENTLNVHIRRIRQKIESDPKNPVYIITVFGIGYSFGE